MLKNIYYKVTSKTWGCFSVTFIVYMCTVAHWTGQVLQGTRIIQPCLTVSEVVNAPADFFALFCTLFLCIFLLFLHLFHSSRKSYHKSHSCPVLWIRKYIVHVLFYDNNKYLEHNEPATIGTNNKLRLVLDFRPSLLFCSVPVWNDTYLS